jgi:hypothetical protein
MPELDKQFLRFIGEKPMEGRLYPLFGRCQAVVRAYSLQNGAN